MTWYVEIPAVNGRHEFLQLIVRLDERGFGDRVDYCQGGWFDTTPDSVQPHLKFENADDALAYVLAYGGELTKTIPIRHSGQ